jgi:MoaA/NifB/PqqE/SkfB family radical SAM enzyme
MIRWPIFLRQNRKSLAPVLIAGTGAFWLRLFLKLYFVKTAMVAFRHPVMGVKALLRIQSYRRSFEGKRSIMRKFVGAGGKYYFASDSPGFPGPLFREFLRDECRRRGALTEGHGQEYIPVQTVFWGITNRCPLQCTHCYDWDNIDNRDRLGLDQLMEVLAIFRQQGIRHVQLSGGEPMARFDELVKLVQAASPSMECWLLTSAYGFSASRALALKEAGLLGVNISLDHWQQDKHNAFRQNGQSHQWAMQAIDHGRQAGLLVSLSLCVTREMASWENLMAYATLARDRGVHFVRMLEPREVGRFSGMEVLLDAGQVERVSRFVRQMNSGGRFRDFPAMVFFGYHQRTLGCMGAGDRYLYVDANGDMHACPFCRGGMGNLLETPYRDILKKVQERGCHLFARAQPDAIH